MSDGKLIGLFSTTHSIYHSPNQQKDNLLFIFCQFNLSLPLLKILTAEVA
ncbi:MAG: hypothetical protein JWR23_2504 [Mucilaginibacter sp.]|nr:hypothetical protein [Mucilaginibacter sp.]